MKIETVTTWGLKLLKPLIPPLLPHSLQIPPSVVQLLIPINSRPIEKMGVKRSLKWEEDNKRKRFYEIKFAGETRY